MLQFFLFGDIQTNFRKADNFTTFVTDRKNLCFFVKIFAVFPPIQKNPLPFISTGNGLPQIFIKIIIVVAASQQVGLLAYCFILVKSCDSFIDRIYILNFPLKISDHNHFTGLLNYCCQASEFIFRFLTFGDINVKGKNV